MRDYIGLSASGGLTPAEQVKTLLTLAENEYKRGQYIKSAEYLHGVLKLNPANTIAQHNLLSLIDKSKTTSSVALKIIDQALEALPRSVELDDLYVDLLYLKAKYYAHKRDFEKTLMLYEIIVATNPFHRVCVMASWVYLQLAQSETSLTTKQAACQRALECVDRYLIIHAGDLPALAQKMTVLAAMRKYTEVVKIAEEILEVAGSAVTGTVGRDGFAVLASRQKAYTLLTLKRYEELVSFTDEILKRVAGSEEFVKYLHITRYTALDLWANGKGVAPVDKRRLLEEGLRSCEEAIKIKPDDMDHARMGNFIFALHGAAEALVYLDAVLKDARSNSKKLLSQKFGLLSNQHDSCTDETDGLELREKMLSCCQKMLTLSPIVADDYTNLGVSLNLLKRWGEAIVKLESALTQAQFRSMRVYNQLILAYLYEWRETTDLTKKQELSLKVRAAIESEAHEEPGDVECDQERKAILRKFGWTGERVLAASEKAAATRETVIPGLVVAAAGAGEPAISAVPAAGAAMGRISGAIAKVVPAAGGAGASNGARLRATAAAAETSNSFESFDPSMLTEYDSGIARGAP